MSPSRTLQFAALAALFASSLAAQKITVPLTARVSTQVHIEYENTALAGQQVTITLTSNATGTPVSEEVSVTLDTEGKAKLARTMPAGPVYKVNAPGATEAAIYSE